MGNATSICIEALLGQTPDYDDYVDDEGDIDITSYTVALMAWRVRKGRTLQEHLHVMGCISTS